MSALPMWEPHKIERLKNVSKKNHCHNAKKLKNYIRALSSKCYSVSDTKFKLQIYYKEIFVIVERDR